MMTSQSSDLRGKMGQIYKCVFDREVKLKKPNVSATESLVYLSFILKAVHRKMFLFFIAIVFITHFVHLQLQTSI